MKELWFNVPVCDRHWHMVAGDREPVRIKEGVYGKDELKCVKCDEPCPSPIFVRASWKMA